MHNGETWIDGCLQAVLLQTVLAPEASPCRRPVQLELSAFDDGSADGSWAALLGWRPRLEAAGISVVLSRSGGSSGGGCGFAKNRAVAQSTGEWLCFHDVDDVSMPGRIEAQLAAAFACPDALIGTRVVRHPLGSTDRYVCWANGMSPAELHLHRFRECTLLMPTWFLSRASFVAAGGFREEQCEDLLFLHTHVRRGGSLLRVDEPLVEYRYHPAAATHAIPRRTILRHRAAALERDVLLAHPGWARFVIWGAGRDGKELFKALSPATRRRVTAFCDIDPVKIGSTYQYYEHHVSRSRRPVTPALRRRLRHDWARRDSNWGLPQSHTPPALRLSITSELKRWTIRPPFPSIALSTHA